MRNPNNGCSLFVATLLTMTTHDANMVFVGASQPTTNSTSATESQSPQSHHCDRGLFSF